LAHFTALPSGEATVISKQGDGFWPHAIFQSTPAKRKASIGPVMLDAEAPRKARMVIFFMIAS